MTTHTQVRTTKTPNFIFKPNPLEVKPQVTPEITDETETKTDEMERPVSKWVEQDGHLVCKWYLPSQS